MVRIREYYPNEIVFGETIYFNEEWNKSKKYIGKNLTWFLISPSNYDYFKCVYNADITKDQFIETLKNRYRILKSLNENIQLIVHLGKLERYITNSYQDKFFEELRLFLDSIGLKVDTIHFIDGVYNEHSLKIMEKHGITNVAEIKLLKNRCIYKLTNKIGLKGSFVQNVYESLKKGELFNFLYYILGEFKPVREKTIHVEALVRNDIWKALEKNVIGRNYTWYIITPANFDYCKLYFNIELNKTEFSKILSKRIKYLKENNEQIGLHIHLSINKNYINAELQKQKFREAFLFLSSLGISPHKFVAGWWNYNATTIKLAKEYGIQEISDYNVNPFKNDQFVGGIRINFTYKYWHDFDF